MRKTFSFLTVGCAVLVILGLIGGGIVAIIYGAKPLIEKLTSKKGEHQPEKNDAPPSAPAETKNLLEAREHFQTRLVNHVARKQNRLDWGDTDYRLIRYGNDFRAVYFEPKGKGNKKFPAIVWAHNGTGGVSEDLWKMLEPFRRAGFAVMCPAFRGEQDNPGEFEWCYGEVNDLLDAIKHVRANTKVDPERVYVLGQKGGGTLSLLCATTGNKDVRAFFALAPIADLEDYARANLVQRDTPFDINNRDEIRLRSAIRFTKFIEQPTFVFNPQNPSTLDGQAQRMLDEAKKLDRHEFHAYSIRRANPDDLPDKLIPLFVQKFQADTGAECNIDFTKEELAEQFR
jgi:pimeloyl-ACP methyl ester carboxylesterase